MNKENILAKSRRENMDKDLFEREVQINAGNVGACTATILATIFFVAQIFVGLGANYGFHAIIFSILATGYIVKSLHLKRKREIMFAVLHTAVALILSAAHIYTLITTSPNL